MCRQKDVLNSKHSKILDKARMDTFKRFAYLVTIYHLNTPI